MDGEKIMIDKILKTINYTVKQKENDIINKKFFIYKVF